VLSKHQTVAACLLQATSLSFIVAAIRSATLLDEASAATGAALIGAGLFFGDASPFIGAEALGGSAVKRKGHER
jgi:hypothetical protein